MRHILSTALVAVIVSLVTVTAAGALAQSPEQPATTDPAFELAGINADSVDGRHAVGARASKTKRAGKLVATNGKGFLPSNVVKPKWSLIQGTPAGFADGLDDVGYYTYVDTQTFSVGNTPISVFIGHPDSLDSEAQMLPIAAGDEVIITEETYKRYDNVSIGHWYRVARHTNSTNATVQFRVRVRLYDTGITPVPVALKTAIKDQIVVKVAKHRT